MIDGATVSRRGFGACMVSAAFAVLLACATTASPGRARGYGALQRDPAGLIDLPASFSYRIISSAGDPMDDGFVVPGNADGIGVIPLDA